MSVTIGVLDSARPARVMPWGAIERADGSGTLDWYIAADDRWHVPANEPTVRQARLDGTAVVETRVRVPSGDVVHRAFAVPDGGGLAVIEVHNDSALPVAVAFAGMPVRSLRPAPAVPIEGIRLPDDAVVFPIGHHATVTIAVALDAQVAPGTLPARLPSATQVAGGWTLTCDRAGRFELPDATLVESIVATRCELLLGGPVRWQDDPVEFLLGVDQIVRMMASPDAWLPDVAEAVAAVARSARRAAFAGEHLAALDAAARVVRAAGDGRALGDLIRLRRRLAVARAAAGGDRWLPDPSTITGARRVAATERRFALGGDLLPAGLPSEWFGQHFAVHGIPAEADARLSFAIRWHGDRPAVLWEVDGAPTTLTATSVAPGWSSVAVRGEALWPAVPAFDGAGSFS